MRMCILILIPAGLMMGCSTSVAKDNFVVQIQECVDSEFSHSLATPNSLDSTADFSLGTIALLASNVQEPLRSSLVDAGNSASHETNSKSAGIYVDHYFDVFTSDISKELLKTIPVRKCDQVGGSEDTIRASLFNVAINQYFEQMMGDGELHRWFDENGGDYLASSFLAAMVSMQLTGQKPDIDAWKDLYRKRVKRFSE